VASSQGRRDPPARGCASQGRIAAVATAVSLHRSAATSAASEGINLPAAEEARIRKFFAPPPYETIKEPVASFAEHRKNKVPPEIVVNVTPNNPPSIKIAKPGRDVKVSPVEELQVKANVGSLSPGTYDGTVTINSNAVNGPLTVPVRFEVTEKGAPVLTVAAQENGARVQFAASPAGGERALSLRVEPGPTAQGIATLGEGGYRTHQVEFSREGVTSLLAGSGIDLVRIAFPERGPYVLDGDTFQANTVTVRAGPLITVVT